MLHPGRAWAAKLPENPETVVQLAKKVSDFLAGKAVPIIPPEEAVIKEEGEAE